MIFIVASLKFQWKVVEPYKRLWLNESEEFAETLQKFIDQGSFILKESGIIMHNIKKFISQLKNVNKIDFFETKLLQ